MGPPLSAERPCLISLATIYTHQRTRFVRQDIGRLQNTSLSRVASSLEQCRESLWLSPWSLEGRFRRSREDGFAGRDEWLCPPGQLLLGENIAFEGSGRNRTLVTSSFPTCATVVRGRTCEDLASETRE